MDFDHSNVDLFDVKERNAIVKSAWCKDDDSGIIQTRTIQDIATCFCGTHPLLSKSGQRNLESDDGKIIRFLQIGNPRSGSTVALQIINELCPGEVKRTHNIQDSCPLLNSVDAIICTVRHPYDIVGSLLRLSLLNEEDAVNKISRSMSSVNAILGITNMNWLSIWLDVPSVDCMFIRYEDFYDKDVKRVKDISNFLEIKISDYEIEQIAQKFSIDENNKNPSRIRYGMKHIGPANGVPGFYRDKISQGLKDKLYENYGWFFQTFNYER